MKRTALLLLVTMIALPASAATLLSTDMGSAAVNPATDTTLDGLTTGTIGGTWDSNFTPTNNQKIVGNAGATDYALLIDEGGQAGSANGAYAEVFLKDSVSFTDNAVTVSFDMGIAYTGTARELTMTGYAANGTTKVFEMIWDQKTLRFAYVENSGTTMMWGDDSLRLAETIAATGAYDPALMATFTVILDGTDLTYNCTAEQSSSDVTTSGDIGVTVLNSTTELSSIRFAISGTSSNDQAIWLDNVEVQGVPEPATMSLLALGGMAMLRRKKK